MPQGSSKLNTKPAIFLDRDGTLMEEVHYCKEPKLVRLIPGTVEALRTLRDAGYVLVIVTNQSGIGRGKFTLEDFEAVQARLMDLLGHELIAATYMCPDAPGAPSARRKPSPAMLQEAASDLGLDLSRSWMIGDKAIDVTCGLRAGTRSILVRTGHGSREDGAGADFIAENLASAAQFILRASGAR